MALSEEDERELLERRLSEQVRESVEGTLKRRYAWVVGMFLGLYGLGGWALVTNLVQDEIDELVQSRVQKAIDAAEQVRLRALLAEERVSELREEADLALAALARLEEKVSETVTEIDGQVALINEQVASLGVRLATAETVARSFESARAELEKLDTRLSAITSATQMLAERADVTVPEVPIVATTAAGGADGAQTTVYFQWSGASAERVKALTGALKASGFNVPGNEQVATDVREVRYFHDADRGRAQRLARATVAALEDEGVAGPEVRVRDLTYWTRAKPPVGTIELWLDLRQ